MNHKFLRRNSDIVHVNMHTHRSDAGWAEVSLTALFLGAEGMNDLRARVCQDARTRRTNGR